MSKRPGEICKLCAGWQTTTRSVMKEGEERRGGGEGEIAHVEEKRKRLFVGKPQPATTQHTTQQWYSLFVWSRHLREGDGCSHPATGGQADAGRGAESLPFFLIFPFFVRIKDVIEMNNSFYSCQPPRVILQISRSFSYPVDCQVINAQALKREGRGFRVSISTITLKGR